MAVCREEFKVGKSIKSMDPEFSKYSRNVQEGSKCGELGSKKQMHNELWEEGL